MLRKFILIRNIRFKECLEKDSMEFTFEFLPKVNLNAKLYRNFFNVLEIDGVFLKLNLCLFINELRI